MLQARGPGDLELWLVQLWTSGQINQTWLQTFGREPLDKLVGLVRFCVGKVLFVCSVCGSTEAFPASARGGRQTQDLPSAQRKKGFSMSTKGQKSCQACLHLQQGAQLSSLACRIVPKQKAAPQRAR